MPKNVAFKNIMKPLAKWIRNIENKYSKSIIRDTNSLGKSYFLEFLFSRRTWLLSLTVASVSTPVNLIK